MVVGRQSANAGPPWRRTGSPCPAPQELRFLPRLKTEVSTEERPDDRRPTARAPPRPPGTLPISDGILHTDLLPQQAGWELSTALRHHRDPYVGVTTNGHVEPGLYSLRDTGTQPRKACDAALAYLATLAPHERAVAHLPMDSPDWRLWTNALPSWAPKGLRLDRLTDAQRAAALSLVEASLSAEGYHGVRSAMALNGALGAFVESYQDTLGEFTYHLTVFGEPGKGSPWGWQLMGHHVDLHCVVVGSQVVLAPVFLGAEPTFDATGPRPDLRVFDAETDRGLDLRRALTADQEDRFLLGDSLLRADLPAELAGPFDGRHLGGAGRDNLVLPYEGILGSDLTDDQRDLLLDLARVYTSRLRAEHAPIKFDQVVEHLDRTHFAWRGRHDDIGAFYYRIHSPVLLVEYDNHPGIFLDNDEPERFHVHTIVREPNGSDYGTSLLAQHYARHHA